MAVYSSLKALRFPEKVQSLPPGNPEIRAPLHIRLKPTNVCNHDCSYCAYHADDLQLGKDMVMRDSIPRERMMELVNDFATMGVKAVTFSGGGEPFLYPHLTEACEGLIKHGIKFASLTNGSMVRGKIAEIFAHHATWLRVSIDGYDAESYAKYRNVSLNEFDKVMGNMKNFQALGGSCYLGASFNIDRSNCTRVFEMASRLKDIGVRSIKLSPCIMGNSAQQNNDYHQPFYESTKDLCRKTVFELNDANFEVHDCYHLLDTTFHKDYHWCPFIQIVPVIGADLNVYSCRDKAYNLESGYIGSLKNQSFRDYWFSNKNQFFTIDPSRDCNHHCAVHNQNQTILSFLDLSEEHLEFI